MNRSRGSARIGVVALVLSSILAAFPAAASNDPLSPQQWSLAKIQAEPAWAHSRGNGIKVAVVDTGVDLNHEDLAGKVAGSFNCIKGAGNDQPCDPVPGGDDNGHGTQVSGIIASIEGNGKGIAPVAPGVSILSYKSLNSDGSGNLSDVIRGIRSAADHGARVINLSLGPEVNLINDLLNLILGANPRQEFTEAFRYAAEKGALVVAAAGNSGTGSFFSGIENVYVVGSTGPGDEVASYSSSGAEIFAPGGNSTGACDTARCINTTSPGGYKVVQGTSFAAPHVAGVAALTIAQGLGASQARARINDTADLIQDGKRLNALRAVTAGSDPAPAPQPTARPAPPRPRQPVRPPLPPVAPPVPVPPIEVVVPILVLSSTHEVHEAPAASNLAASRPPARADEPAVRILALALLVATAVGHGLFRVSRRSVI